MYQFSKDSYEQLKKFMEKVEHTHKQDENTQIWQKFLPKDNELINTLNNHQVVSEESIAIDLNSQDLYEEIRNNINATLSKFHISKLEDNLRGDLSPEMLKSIIEQYTLEELETVFINIQHSNDKTFIYNLGDSLNSLDYYENTIFLTLFCRFLLNNELNTGTSERLKKLFINLLEKHSVIVCKEFSPNLATLEEDSCVRLKENLSNLSEKNKQIIFRDFIQYCTSLKSQHFSIIETILVDNIDIDTIRKLIELLKLIANDYMHDKSFGQFLYEILRKINRNAKYFEDSLRYIIENHKSNWKIKMLRLFNQQMRHEVSSMNITMY